MADVTGSCLCGAVRYRINGPLMPVKACHCTHCRKTSGHHVAATSALRSDMVIEGALRWYRSSAEAQRGFCPTCGSNLFYDGFSGRLAISAGTLDGDSGLEMEAHIYVADKGDYYRICDGLPQFEGDDEE